VASNSLRFFQQQAQDSPADTAIVVGRGNADLVDPELAWFVGMHVIQCRSEADNHAAIQRDGEMMSFIGKELRGKTWGNLVIEHAVSDVFEDSCVVLPEQEAADWLVARAGPHGRSIATRALLDHALFKARASDTICRDPR
jgi:hypothetical protein